MATELARQISLISASNLEVGGLHTGKPSLFLSAKEAASVDIAEIYDAAWNALLKLQHYEPRFGSFSETLLHPSSIHSQRELKTQEENKALNKEVNSLLSLLGLFITDSCAHTVLEYLIRRHRVHEMNKDKLLQCCLSIHDSKIFARIVQLCSTDGTWGFLSGVKKSGSPLPRVLLVKQCHHDNELLQMLRSTTCSLINMSVSGTVDLSSSSGAAGGHRVVAFFTAVVLEMAAGKSFNDSQLRIITPYMLGGLDTFVKSFPQSLRGPLDTWRKSCCVVIAQIAASTRLGQPLLASMIEAVVRVLQVSFSSQYLEYHDLKIELIQLLGNLCQYQSIEFTGNNIKVLFGDPDSLEAMVSALDELKNLFDFSSLVRSILCSTCKLISQAENGSAASPLPFASLEVDIVRCLVARGLVDDEMAKTVLVILFTSWLESRHSTPPPLVETLRFLAQRFPRAFDERAAHVSEAAAVGPANTAAPGRHFQDLLSEVFAKTPFRAPASVEAAGNGPALSLLLSLSDASLQMRICSLASFGERVERGLERTLDVVGVAEAAARNLMDPEADVALAAWDLAVVQRVAEYVDTEMFLHACSTAVSFWFDVAKRSVKKGAKVLCAIVVCLADSFVAGALCARDESGMASESLCVITDQGVSLTGDEWLFSTVVALGCGLVPLTKACDDENEGKDAQESSKKAKKYAKYSKYIDAMSAVAFAAATALGASKQLTIFQGLDSTSAGGNVERFAECLAANIVNEVASNANSKSESLHLCSRLLFQFSHRAQEALQKGVDDVVVRPALLLSVRLCVVLTSRWRNEKPSQSNLSTLGAWLSLTVPLVISAMPSNSVSSTAIDSLVPLISALAVMKSTHPPWNADPIGAYPSLQAFASGASSPASGGDLPYRLLIAMLCSPQGSALAHVGVCLSSLFPLPTAALIRIVASCNNGDEFNIGQGEKDFESWLSKWYDDTDVENSAHITSVPASARAGALHCLSAWVVSLADSRVEIDDSILWTLYLVTLVSAGACHDGHPAVRTAALSVCGKVASCVDCTRSTKLPCDSLPSSAAVILDMPALRSISKALADKGAAIAMDASSAASALASGIFSALGADGPRVNAAHLFLFGARIFASSVPALSTSILNAAVTCPLATTWPFLHSIIDASTITDEIDDGVIRAIMRSISSVHSSPEAIQSAVIEWMNATLRNGTRTRAGGMFGVEIVSLVASGVLEGLGDQELKNSLFKSLLTAHTFNPFADGDASNGRPALIAPALENITIAPLFLVELVEEIASQYFAAHKRLVGGAIQSTSTAGGGQLEYDDERVMGGSGMSVAVQRLASALEVLGPCVKRTDAQVAGALVGKFLNLVELTSHESLGFVLSAEYCRSVLVDLAWFCFTRGGDAIFAPSSRAPATPVAAKRSRGRKAATAVDSQEQERLYTKEQMNSHTRMVLLSLASAKTLQLQSATLRLLKAMLALHPAAIPDSIQALGELLSLASLSSEGNRNALIEEILSVLVPEGSASVSGAGVQGPLSPQDLLQPLFVHVTDMSHSSREAVVALAIRVLGPQSLPACVNALLAHVLATHETGGGEGGGEVEVTGDALILLSRSAQRKAQRQLRTSLPEDLFRLVVGTSVSLPAVHQLGNLIIAVKSAHILLAHAFQNDAAAQEVVDVGEKQGIASWKSDDGQRTVLDALSLRCYCANAISRRIGGKGKNVDDDNDGNATFHSEEAAVEEAGTGAALCLLQLEYVFEMLENTKFHASVASLLDDDDDDDEIEMAGEIGANSGHRRGRVLQLSLLELCDQLLQLYAFASHAQVAAGAESNSAVGFVNVRLGDSRLRILCGALAKRVSNWCLDILRNTQRLLDAPTFVAILQELLSHRDSAVRQKALQMLAMRLQEIGDEDSVNGTLCSLLLDRSGPLRSTMQQALGTDGADEEDVEDLNPTQRLGLAQSAVMCIDLLARSVGDAKAKSRRRHASAFEDVLPTLESALADAIQLCSDLLAKEQSLKRDVDEDDSDAEFSSDIVKLLGSAFLLCGSLVATIAPHGLPHLGTLMTLMTSAIARQHRDIAMMVADWDDENVDPDVVSISRSRVLSLRSALTACSTVVAKMPTFSHPFLVSILNAALPVHQLHEVPPSVQKSIGLGSLSSDVTRCLSLVMRKIPPRLSVPLVLKGVPSLLSKGAVVTANLGKLLNEQWQALDRQIVLTFLNELSATSILLLDFRRAYGSRAGGVEDVDEEIVDAVLQFCMKLTELELKRFLSRLAEWRDLESPEAALDVDGDASMTSTKKRAGAMGVDSEGAVVADSSWRRHARGVIFFRLAAALCNKLKSIFTPCMGTFWGQAKDAIAAFIEAGTVVEAVMKSVKKAKKQRREDGTAAEESKTAGEMAELLLRARHCLEAIRLTCVHDASHLVDEALFELMMPTVVSLLSLRANFSDDSEYASFCEGSVAPCLAALAVAVGKDLAWKPLNHRVLLLTRDKRAVVRVAGIKVLHKLFAEVGEEYLLLLPECLPFLSELMEDDVQPVTAAAGALIKHVEELSGEDLDSYLQ